MSDGVSLQAALAATAIGMFFASTLLVVLRYGTPRNLPAMIQSIRRTAVGFGLGFLSAGLPVAMAHMPSSHSLGYWGLVSFGAPFVVAVVLGRVYHHAPATWTGLIALGFAAGVIVGTLVDFWLAIPTTIWPIGIAVALILALPVIAAGVLLGSTSIRLFPYR